MIGHVKINYYTKNPGYYTIQRLSFSKILFYTYLST